MVKIRPFRLMLWSLLVITAGGSLIVYGSRVSERNRVTYSEMIEGMADMSRSRATQDNPPVLEIWDMGWFIMAIGFTVAVPGAVIMLGSAGTMLFHKLVPEKQEASADGDGGDDDSHEADEEDEHEVGEELLHKRHDISSPVTGEHPAGVARPGSNVPPVATDASIAPLAVPQDIEPVDLVGADEGAGDVDGTAGVDGAASTESTKIQLETDAPLDTTKDTPTAAELDTGVNHVAGARPGPVSSGGDIYEIHDVDGVDDDGGGQERGSGEAEPKDRP